LAQAATNDLQLFACAVDSKGGSDDAVPCCCRGGICRRHSCHSAQAEKRTFIVANNSDDYGVDRCLATNASCGAAIATAYCQLRNYARAESFRRIEREEVTGVVAETTGSSDRDEFVAIECLR
jgi:hypothetical protein